MKFAVVGLSETQPQDMRQMSVQFKGQIVSECPYEKIVSPKIPTKKFPRFLPKPLRRGQIKKIRALYCTN